MEFEGVVWRVLPQIKGTSARGEWVKQEVVFELPGEFNRKTAENPAVSRGFLLTFRVFFDTI